MKHNEKIPRADMLGWDGEERRPFFARPAGKMVSALLMVAIIVAILALGADRGAIAYEMDDAQLAVACLDAKPLFIPYDRISQVTLATTFEQGRAIEAADWDAGWCGVYESEDYGPFTLYAYSGAGSYIVVEHEEGVLIFNGKTQKATRQAYEKLLGRVEGKR